VTAHSNTSVSVLVAQAVSWSVTTKTEENKTHPMEGPRRVCLIPARSSDMLPPPCTPGAKHRRTELPTLSAHHAVCVCPCGSGTAQLQSGSSSHWSGTGAYSLMKCHSTPPDPSLLGLSWWKQHQKHSHLQPQTLDHLQNNQFALAHQTHSSFFSCPPAPTCLDSG